MFRPPSRRDAGRVEIRLSLDTVDPPAGRLRVLPGPGEPGGPGAGNGGPAAREAGFCGWLGLLRALYEVTGSPASWP
jgi:hypothetical protein